MAQSTNDIYDSSKQFQGKNPKDLNVWSIPNRNIKPFRTDILTYDDFEKIGNKISENIRTSQLSK